MTTPTDILSALDAHSDDLTAILELWMQHVQTPGVHDRACVLLEDFARRGHGQLRRFIVALTALLRDTDDDQVVIGACALLSGPFDWTRTLYPSLTTAEIRETGLLDALLNVMRDHTTTAFYVKCRHVLNRIGVWHGELRLVISAHARVFLRSGLGNKTHAVAGLHMLHAAGNNFASNMPVEPLLSGQDVLAAVEVARRYKDDSDLVDLALETVQLMLTGCCAPRFEE